MAAHGGPEPRCAVLLRGVNVGSSNRITMPNLRAVLEQLGAHEVKTYLQSGNAVVRAEPDGLADTVREALRLQLGLDVAVIVRTATELAQVVDANPFPARVSEPKLLHVAFLEAAVSASALDAVGTRHGADEIALGDRALYLSFAERSHDSPLNGVLRRLGVVTTARNWTTVTGLLALSRE